MKAIVLFICISVLSISASRADDACCESKTADIQEKIRDIDLSIALKKYEQIQTEKAKAEVQAIIVETQPGNDDERSKEVAALRSRVVRLNEYAAMVKADMLNLSKPITVATTK